MKKFTKYLLIALLAFTQGAWAQTRTTDTISNESELRAAVLTDSANIVLGADNLFALTGIKRLEHFAKGMQEAFRG